MAYTILIFDNRPDNVQTLSSVIRNKFGYRAIMADNIEYGAGWIISERHPQPDLVIIDLINSGSEVLQTIRKVKAAKPQLPVIVMMQYGNDDYAVPIINAGANDFLTKPVGIERLKLSMQNALKIQNLSSAVARLERKNACAVGFSDLIGPSESFKKTLQLAANLAGNDLPVWIDGEQGTGRESLARAIHADSARAGNPFITYNCWDLNHHDSEIALFGDGQKTGLLKMAHTGTIYLNEIAYLSASVQQRVLGFLGNRDNADVRVICSNSKDKSDAMMQGELNKSLYGEFANAVIPLASLCNRKADIAPLAQYFLNIYAASENRFPAILSEDAIQSLEVHPWPGNIRQLANLLYRAVLLSQLDEVDAATLRLVQQLEPVHYSLNTLMPQDTLTLFDRKGQVKKLRSIENEAIKLALKYANGCMTKAARNLGIGRSTLYRKIDEMEAGSYMPLENQTTRPTMPASARELS